MHDLGVTHGNVQMVRLPPSRALVSHNSYSLCFQGNIIVDKDGTPRIAGLSNASILPRSITWTEDSRTSTDRLFRSCAPELIWPGVSPNLTNPIYPTKASDIYAFGVIAWEVRKPSYLSSIFQCAHSRQVLTGRPPFFEMTENAATYRMLSGARPPRPNCHEISDRVWYMIERCWHNVPSKRMSAGEALNLLETELGRTPDSLPLPWA